MVILINMVNGETNGHFDPLARHGLDMAKACAEVGMSRREAVDYVHEHCPTDTHGRAKNIVTGATRLYPHLRYRPPYESLTRAVGEYFSRLFQ